MCLNKVLCFPFEGNSIVRKVKSLFFILKGYYRDGGLSLNNKNTYVFTYAITFASKCYKIMKKKKVAISSSNWKYFLWNLIKLASSLWELCFNLFYVQLLFQMFIDFFSFWIVLVLFESNSLVHYGTLSLMMCFSQLDHICSLPIELYTASKCKAFSALFLSGLQPSSNSALTLGCNKNQ